MGLKYMCNACGTLYDSRVDAALCHPDIVLVYENAAEQNAHLTGGGLCAQCGSPAWTHSARDHAFVEPHHPQVA